MKRFNLPKLFYVVVNVFVIALLLLTPVFIVCAETLTYPAYVDEVFGAVAERVVIHECDGLRLFFDIGEEIEYYDSFYRISYGLQSPILLMMVATLFVAFSAIATGKKDVMVKRTGFSVGMLVTVALLYMILGLVAQENVTNYHINNVGDEFYTYSVSTQAYFPMIFAGVLFVAYVIFANLTENDSETQVIKQIVETQYVPAEQPKEAERPAPVMERPDPVVERPAPAAKPYANIVKAKNLEEASGMILKYKNLMDAGVVTKEEFEQIKAKILGR